MSDTAPAREQSPSVGVPNGMFDLAPVAPNERIHALDLLRGFAMFGVLWSNLNDHYGTRAPATALDGGLAWAQVHLIESRFYTLLCLLFGIGFGMQLLRATERGVDVRTVYYRRSLALLGIGLVHGWLIWHGDILTMYALVAFSLVMFRSVRPRRLLIGGILLWLPGFIAITIGANLAGMKYFMPSILRSATTKWMFAHGSWAQIEPIRVAAHLEWLGHWGLPFFANVLGLFMVGLWATKSGYLRRVIEVPGTTKLLLLGGLVAVLPDFVFTEMPWSTLGGAAVYAAVLLLLWQQPRMAPLLRPLAATGRMALTTYLTQSVVCTLLFYGYGLGWYGTFGYTGMFVLTLILFACQMAASTWWLTQFSFGPVEWLWRTLTYGHMPRMRLPRLATA